MGASPLPGRIVVGAVCAEVLVTRVALLAPHELGRLGGGFGVVDGRVVLAGEPQLVTLGLELLHEDLHGDLHHVLTARALNGTYEEIYDNVAIVNLRVDS